MDTYSVIGASPLDERNKQSRERTTPIQDQRNGQQIHWTVTCIISVSSSKCFQSALCARNKCLHSYCCCIYQRSKQIIPIIIRPEHKIQVTLPGAGRHKHVSLCKNVRMLATGVCISNNALLMRELCDRLFVVTGFLLSAFCRSFC